MTMISDPGGGTEEATDAASPPGRDTGAERRRREEDDEISPSDFLFPPGESPSPPLTKGSPARNHTTKMNVKIRPFAILEGRPEKFANVNRMVTGEWMNAEIQGAFPG